MKTRDFIEAGEMIGWHNWGEDGKDLMEWFLRIAKQVGLNGKFDEISTHVKMRLIEGGFQAFMDRMAIYFSIYEGGEFYPLFEQVRKMTEDNAKALSRITPDADYTKECYLCDKQRKPALTIKHISKPVLNFCKKCTLKIYNDKPTFEGGEE